MIRPKLPRRWFAAVRPLFLLPLAASCAGHINPAVATMSGLEAPVLLGPVDRVGGGPPLPVQVVGEFEATSTHLTSHSESEGTTTDVTIIESEMSQEAEYATRDDARKEIRLTEVKPQAVGVWVSIKSRVDIEGDVVQVSTKKVTK